MKNTTPKLARTVFVVYSFYSKLVRRPTRCHLRHGGTMSSTTQQHEQHNTAAQQFSTVLVVSLGLDRRDDVVTDSKMSILTEYIYYDTTVDCIDT